MDEQDKGAALAGGGVNRLEDLARLAGVSISTASRALNDSPLVSDRTKERIRALALEHDYSGRLRDKLMQSDRSATISVVVPPPHGRDRRISDPFLLDLIGGIADASLDQDCDILLSHVMPSDAAGIDALIRSGRSNGLIFLGQSTLHDQFNRLAAQAMPFVVWGAQLPGQKYCLVGTDNAKGGYRATSHLIRLNRRHIAFLGDVAAPEAELRFQGYRQALSDAGIAIRADLVQPVGFELDAGQQAAQGLLDGGHRVDGIVAASDLIAIGAIRGFLQRGVRVPEDVSVVGYDDIHMAAMTAPAVTTIRQDVTRAGRLLLAKILRLAAGDPAKSELLSTDLVVRESCGA